MAVPDAELIETTAGDQELDRVATEAVELVDQELAAAAGSSIPAADYPPGARRAGSC